MALTQKIEIELTGNTDADLDLALEEAVERIKAGNVVGHDSNDTGSFYFSSQIEGEPEPEEDEENDNDADDEDDDVPGLK